MNKNKQYYLQEPEAVINEFNSNQHGLSSSDAKKRILENGYNELPEAKRDSYATIFLSQFRSPLIYILLTAGIIIFLMGETIDSLVIFFCSFFQCNHRNYSGR